MTDVKQWVAVTFRDGQRPYTYHNEGDPVRVGDLIKVPDKAGDGWQRARVVDLPFDPPRVNGQAVKTKAILGLLEAPEPEAKPEPAPAPGDLFKA